MKRDPLQTECTDDRNSVALCNLIRHDYPLQKMYQNFDFINNVPEGEEEYYGGSVTLADFCPFIQEFTWRSKNVIVRGSQCQFDDNNPSNLNISKLLMLSSKPFIYLLNLIVLTEPEKNFALESYGNHSKCFDHTDNMWEERSCRQTREWQHWGSGCYKYRCDNGRLHILVMRILFSFF